MSQLLAFFLRMLAVLVLAHNSKAQKFPSGPAPTDWSIQMVSMEPCEGKELTLMRFENPVIYKCGRKAYAMNATWELMQTIEDSPENPWDMNVGAEWQDGENSQTKRTVAVVDMKKTCTQLNVDGRSWKAFFDSFVEPVDRVCPIEKGSYTIANYRFDLDSAKGVLQEGIWTMSFTLTYGELSSCYVATLLVKAKYD